MDNSQHGSIHFHRCRIVLYKGFQFPHFHLIHQVVDHGPFIQPGQRQRNTMEIWLIWRWRQWHHLGKSRCYSHCSYKHACVGSEINESMLETRQLRQWVTWTCRSVESCRELQVVGCDVVVTEHFLKNKHLWMEKVFSCLNWYLIAWFCFMY